jgi:tetratricopeptide (TPR) repeat protein
MVLWSQLQDSRAESGRCSIANQEQAAESIFGEALELGPEERQVFLDRICLGQPALRSSVEALLKENDRLQGFLSEPPFTPSGRPAGEDLPKGTRLGRYTIVEPLGSGGMGQVFRAVDRDLQRDVAVKVLHPELAGDTGLVTRFRREARALAALNHPNICTIFEIGEQDGLIFIAMEFLDGLTLRQRMANQRLELETTLTLSIQIADGLDAAHSAGIVHRDIKPGNIFITRRGHVKILDFGVAKVAGARPSGDASTASADHATRPGSVMGTVAYMSPEQVRGKEVDARSDLFSFGVVLYQVATGLLPFRGDSPGLIFDAILNRAPAPLLRVNPDLPAALEEIVGKALEKSPDLRYHHAADMRIDLMRLKRSLEPGHNESMGKEIVGAVSVAEATAAATVPPQKGSEAEHKKLWKIVVASAVLLLVVLNAVWLFYHWRGARVLTNKDTIVLADFDNKTGDTVFDDTLKQGLSVQLEQSPFLDLLSERRVNETLRLMGHSLDDRLTPEVTREVCLRTGSTAMLTGSIAELGSQYVIGLKAMNCNTGDVLAEEQEQAAGKEAVLKALDAAAVSLRSKLGESLNSVEKYATPLEEATTPSLEALKAYSLGVKTDYAKGDTPALPFFQRAVELDPNFAMAYTWISSVYFDLNEIQWAAGNARMAYELREKVSERERFLIEAGYYFFATGELERVAQTDELWQQTYPRDATPYQWLGAISATLGNYEKALEEWRAAQRLEPNNGINYYLLSMAYMSRNRLDEAEAVFRQAEERKLEREELLQSRYYLAFLKGNTAQMAQLASAAMGKPGSEDLLLAMQADTEGWYGKLKNAYELTRRAMDSAQHNDAKETAAGYEAEAALRDVESGDREQARAEANAALKLAPNRDVQVMAALALARAGDTVAAEKLAAELDKTFPLDTLVQRYWLPAIRASVALEDKDPNRAVELLKVASTTELGEPTADLTVFLCPVYVRGEAYLMLHDGKSATAEFQKFIDYRGVLMNFPWGALARLGLARAYAMQGDTAKAKSAYQDFLTLWKDADPDVPILKQAKAEYAKLQ